MEDLHRSSRPSTSSTKVNIAKVKEIETDKHLLTLRQIFAELLASHELIYTILNDHLDTKHVVASHAKTQSHKGH